MQEASVDSRSKARQMAEHAALSIRHRLAPSSPRVALVLGTGWSAALPLENARQMFFSDIVGFDGIEHLTHIEGHSRIVVCGDLKGKNVIALQGRIHLNEDPTHQADVMRMARLQIEMLLKLGVRRFILTNAAGSLKSEIEVGSVVMANSFVSLFAPAMPLFGGEFCAPQDRLSNSWRATALNAARGIQYEQVDWRPLTYHEGAYAMLRGPQFEGRGLDKKMLRDAGASVVGISTYPEMCVIATERDTEALCLSFVTNTDSETHSHEENQLRAKSKSSQLGDLLNTIIEKTVE